MSLKKQKLGLCLHAAIQRIQENVNYGVLEHNQDSNVALLDRSLRAHLSFENPCEENESNLTEDYLHGGGFPSVETKAACTGSDITLSSTESSPGFNSPQNSCPSPKWVSSIPGKTLRNIVSSINRKSQKTKSVGSSNELTSSTGADLQSSIPPSENPRISSEIIVDKLKGDIVTLARQAELSDLELQTLRKQVVKDTKRARDLSNEVNRLKRENRSLNMGCEKCKYFRRTDSSADPWLLIDEYRQELTKEKELNENIKLQLQKMQDSNSGVTLEVPKAEKRVECKENEEFDNSERPIQISEMCDFFTSSCTVDDDGWGEDALNELVLGHRRTEEAHLLEQKNIDLCCEIEVCRREKEEAEAQVEQIALDYEILKQENHELLFKLEQTQIQEQLMPPHCRKAAEEVKHQFEKQGNEILEKSHQSYDSSIAITILENRVKALEEEMVTRNAGFEADLESVISDKVRQEQRAILAEEALKRTRWKNANAAQRLQLEFRRLSLQMESTLSGNERMTIRAKSEADELRSRQKYLEQLLQKADEDLSREREVYRVRLLEHSKVFPAEHMRSEGGGRDIVEDEDSMKEETKKTDFLQRSTTVEKYELENVLMLEKCDTTLNQLEDRKDRPGRVRSNVDELEAECLSLKLMLSRADSEKDELKEHVVQLKRRLLQDDSFIRGERCPTGDEIQQSSQISGKNSTSDVLNFQEVVAAKNCPIWRDVLET